MQSLGGGVIFRYRCIMLFKVLHFHWICSTSCIFSESNHFLLSNWLSYTRTHCSSLYSCPSTCVTLFSSPDAFEFWPFTDPSVTSERLGSAAANLLSSIPSQGSKITCKFPRERNTVPVNCLKNNLLVLKECLFLANFLMKNRVETIT